MLDYDAAADEVFEKLKVVKGRPSTKDLRIAAIAVAHGASLVTANQKDFARIPGLALRPFR